MIKVCGITRLDDALHAVGCGATALGFVFWPRSPRYIAPERAAEIVRQLPAAVEAVGVFVSRSPEEVARAAGLAGVSTIQLHGDEPPAFAAAFTRPVWRAVSLHDAPAVVAAWPASTTFLLDAYDPVRRGGTGRPIDWPAAARVALERRVVLAGGLTAENVEEAVATVRPFGVDVSSGVEEAPGVKDFDKMARFLARAREALDGR